MSAPQPYAFEPRRKRSLDADIQPSSEEYLSDSSEGDIPEDAAAVAQPSPSSSTASVIVKKCTRDLHILEPDSEKKCVLQLEIVHDAITDSSIKLAWRRAQRCYWKNCRPDMLAFARMTPENYRFHGYQCYVEFIHGHLGRGVRQAVPACVEKHLRRRYPDPHDQYTGFKQGRAGDKDEVACALADL